jgi:hypothetical protein
LTRRPAGRDRPADRFASFGRVVVFADKSIPYSADPEADRRRVAAHISGFAVVGLLNGIEIRRMALRQVEGGVWSGWVDCRHPLLAKHATARPRRLRRRACHELLNAFLGGRGAELLESFGWGKDGIRLDYAGPETETTIALAQLISPHDPWRVMRGSLAFAAHFLSDRVIDHSIKELAKMISVERSVTGAYVVDYVGGAMRAAG